MLLSKKIRSISFLLIFILGLSSSIYFVRGHNPTDMTLSYSTITNELSVTITHSVSDPNTHYIESVIIRVNGSIVATESYTSQPTTSIFTYI